MGEVRSSHPTPNRATTEATAQTTGQNVGFVFLAAMTHRTASPSELMRCGSLELRALHSAALQGGLSASDRSATSEAQADQGKAHRQHQRPRRGIAAF